MSTDPSSLLEYTVLLSRHKQNETLYKQKIKQLNYTRLKISDQFQLLEQTYDKKLKALENKLQSFKSQNEQLVRQNLIYRADLQNYQSRLIEKEKIIGVLLGQKKDIVISSDRSKSQKTQSLNAHEDEQSRINKRQILAKDKYQVQILGKSKISQTLPVQQKISPSFLKQMGRDITEGKGSLIKNSIQEKVFQQVEDKPEQKQKKINQTGNGAKTRQEYSNYANAERLTLTQKKERQQSRSHSQDDEEKIQLVIQPVKIKNSNKTKSPPPPLPPIKKKKKPTQFKQFYEAQDEYQAHQITQYAEAIQLNNQRPDEEQPQKDELLQPYAYGQQTVQLQPQHQPQSNVLHHVSNDNSSAQQGNYLSHFNTQQNQYQVQESQAAQNNLLSHFTSNVGEISTQPYGGAKVFSRNKKKKKSNQGQESQNASKNINRSEIYSQKNEKDTKKDKKNDSSSFTKPYLSRQNLQDGHIEPTNNAALPLKGPFKDVGNANEFFSNFNRDFQEQDHHLQMMQSSIDHIERDSSIISNEQPYFDDMNLAQKQKPIKMPKKKAKRDQIKQMNPSMFQ